MIALEEKNYIMVFVGALLKIMTKTKRVLGKKSAQYRAYFISYSSGIEKQYLFIYFFYTRRSPLFRTRESQKLKKVLEKRSSRN